MPLNEKVDVTRKSNTRSDHRSAHRSAYLSAHQSDHGPIGSDRAVDGFSKFKAHYKIKSWMKLCFIESFFKNIINNS